MITIKGKYCKDCIIYANDVEEEAMQLIYGILDSPAFDGQKIRIQPDVHAGKGICIGFTSTLGDFVSPAHVGCDIGCTVSAALLPKAIPSDKYAALELGIRKAVKFGFDIHEKTVIDEKEFYKFLSQEFRKTKSSWPEMVGELPENATEDWVSKQLKRLGMDEGVFYKSLGTVGGGNHFIEVDDVDKDSECGRFLNWESMVTVHCGSRNFGQKVFNYWHKVASNPAKLVSNKEIAEQVKASEPDKAKWGKMISDAIAQQAAKHPSGYLFGEHLQGYMLDMVFAQAYARFNHVTIHARIAEVLKKLGIRPGNDFIFTTHNYIDFADKIIRKGAVKAEKGHLLLVPFNMRDGIAVCEGLSNPDWNNSCSHGAGRKMSRSKAFANLSMDEFTKEMDGIYSTSVCQGTLDESPMAYKDSNEIREMIDGTTVDVLALCKPKINLKAS